jgi:hypothetical protein
VIRPGGTPDPVLAANPAYTHVHRLRIHDPCGLTYQNLLIGATHRRANPGDPLDPSSVETGPQGRDRVVQMLRRWERALSRLDVRTVRHDRGLIRGPVESLQKFVFVGELAREVNGFNDPDRFDLTTGHVRRRMTVSDEEQERQLDQWYQAEREFNEGFEAVPVAAEGADTPTPAEAAASAPPHGVGASSAGSPRRMSRDEANRRARELMDKDTDFRDKGQREWAAAIGCSDGLVADLPTWRAVMEETGRSRKTQAANASERPKAVSLTRKVLAVTGKDQDPLETVATDEIMRKLIEAATPERRAELNNLTHEQRQELADAYVEQQRDAEPSPLDEDRPDRTPTTVRERKHL